MNLLAGANRTRRCSNGVWILLLAPAFLQSQSVTHSAVPATLDSLAARTQLMTERFVDRRVAIAEGYRLLGPDFPGMGEHWLNPSVVMRGVIDPSKPTLLAYASIEGKVRLLGAGYVVTTIGAEKPKRLDVPGWPDAWHEHSGLFADESGARGARASVGVSETHVWVLHVWTLLPNPLGAFEPDNWALPFARAGIAVSADVGPVVDADAARAFALAFGGDVYLRDVLTDASVRVPAREAAIDSAIATARESARTVARAMQASMRIRDADVSVLRAIWHDLAHQLEGIAGPEIKSFMAPPHGTSATPGHVHKGTH